MRSSNVSDAASIGSLGGGGSIGNNNNNRHHQYGSQSSMSQGSWGDVGNNFHQSGGGGGRHRSTTTMGHDPHDRDAFMMARTATTNYNNNSNNAQDRGSNYSGGSVRSGDGGGKKRGNGFIVSDKAYDNYTSSHPHPQQDDDETFNPAKYNYQDLIHASAMTRLETELRDFIRSRPLSTWTEYDGNGGGFQASGKFPLPVKKGANNDATTTEIDTAGLDPTKSYFAERSGKESAERIYSKSAIQRYIVQRLATELNGENEVKRDFHSYEAFKKAFASPESSKIDLIKPSVVERPRPIETTSKSSNNNNNNNGQFNGGGDNPFNNNRRGASPNNNNNNNNAKHSDPRVATSSYELFDQQFAVGNNNNNNGDVDVDFYDSSSSAPVYKPGSYSHQQAKLRAQQLMLLQQQQMRNKNGGSPLGITGGGGYSSSPSSGALFANNNSNTLYSSSFPGGGNNKKSGGGPPPPSQAFLNMYNFPNVDTDTFYVYRN